MKHTFKIYLLFFLIIPFSFHYSQTENYEFKSAYIKKVVNTSGSGVNVNTTKEIFIDQNGKVTASYENEKREIKSLKKTEERETVLITDGEWIIVYNPETKEGTKRKNILAKKFKNLSGKDTKKMSEGMKEALNAETKDLGTEVVAGKKCKVTQTTSNIAGIKTVSKLWTYGNYVMKSESESLGNKVKEEVIIFKEGEKFDKSKLTVPKEVKLKEVKY